MRAAAEALLRRALAEGTVTVAELQGFGQMDYAGVARILKLDAGLSEAVIAVKLQEIGGAALLAMQATDLAPALSLTQAQQSERLEAFLSALKEVAASPDGCAQHQQTVSAAADAVGTSAGAVGAAAVTATKRKRRSDPEAATTAAPVQRKAPAVPKGLRAPRVSGLKRPAPTASAAGSSATAPTPVSLPVTAAVARSDATQLQQQLTEAPVPQEGEGSSIATDLPTKQRQKREKRQSKTTKGKSLGEREVKNQLRMEQQKQQQQQQPETANSTKGPSHLREKLTAWASSILGLKSRFDSVLKQQAAHRSRRVLLSTTGFTEGAGVQNELPALVRRLGALDGASAAFEWKPQHPEKITHLICSNELLRPTVKLYFALVNGASILKEEFLQEAKKQKAWPDPQQFQRADFPSVELREKSRWLLRSLPVCIDGPYRPSGLSKQQLQALVFAAGGAVADDASATIRILEDAETLRRRQARGLWSFQGEGATQPVAISAQWLLDCIRSWQLLPRDQYVLSLSNPLPNNLDGNTTDAAGRKRQKEAKAGNSLGEKEKTRRGRTRRLDYVGEGCDDSPHSEASTVPKEGNATLQTAVEKPQGPLGRDPHGGAVPKENAPNTTQPIHMQQGQAQDSEPNPAQSKLQGDDASVAKDVAQQAVKKRSSCKRLRSEDKKPHENVSRKKKMVRPAPVKEKEDIAVLPPAADALPGPGDEIAAAAADEEGGAPLGAAAVPERQSLPTDKLAEGTPAGEGGCSTNEDGLAASPAADDWEPPDGNVPIEERAAEETLAFSAAAPAPEAATDCPQRDCPGSTSQATASGDPLQLPGEHLDVAGLFEPDEADTAEYNFDLKDHCSMGQKLDEIHTNEPANTQRESVSESHLNENLPSNNSK